MAGYAWRAILALVGFGLFMLIAPLFMDVIGLQLAANVWQLIKILVGVIALCYVVWGPPVPWRSA